MGTRGRGYGRACGGGGCSRTNHWFTSPRRQEVDSSLVVERPKVHKVFAHSRVAISRAFELISHSSNDVVDAGLTRNEIFTDGNPLKCIVCCPIAFAGPIACASEVVCEHLTFEVVGTVGNTDEIVEDCQSRP